MNKFKLCFWLNVPSPHQEALLNELSKDINVDLVVRYFEKQDSQRLKIGWKNNISLKYYEKQVESIDKAFIDIEDWKERIHIVTGFGFQFNKQLIPILIKNKVNWVHWSERFGLILASKLKFNITLFNLLRPIYLITKRNYANMVNKYALGCFSQGYLAKKDFIDSGIKAEKIENLFYSINLDNNLNKNHTKKIIDKNNFLYVGTLSKRKGIKDLIEAFDKLKNNGSWSLILVGEDLENGYYQEIVKKKQLSEKIFFVGPIQGDKMQSYYNSSDVLILPSRFDGWGAVLNEGMFNGLALIASDQCGAAYHIIDDNRNGFIFKAGNTRDLSSKMQYYVNNSNLLNEHKEFSKVNYEKYNGLSNKNRLIQALELWLNNKIKK